VRPMNYAALTLVLVLACRSTLAEPPNLNAIPSDLAERCFRPDLFRQALQLIHS